MSGYQDRLGDYVEVKDRIRLLYEQHPDARLVTDEVRWPHPDDDVQRIAVKALAYRTPDDPHPGVGWSWMVLPGSTPYTKGSELENTETSAWGRAIGALGIGIDKGIASAQEVAAKAGAEATEKPNAEERLAPRGEITRKGTIAKGSGRHSDLAYRQTPDGYHVGFRLEIEDGKAIPQVVAQGALGLALYAAGGELLGQSVEVTGELYEVQVPGRRPIFRLVATRIESDEWTVPAESVEAESMPLFDDAEQSAIDDALAAVAGA